MIVAGARAGMATIKNNGLETLELDAQVMIAIAYDVVALFCSKHVYQGTEGAIGNRMDHRGVFREIVWNDGLNFLTPCLPSLWRLYFSAMTGVEYQNGIALFYAGIHPKIDQGLKDASA